MDEHIWADIVNGCWVFVMVGISIAFIYAVAWLGDFSGERK